MSVSLLHMASKRRCSAVAPTCPGSRCVRDARKRYSFQAVASPAQANGISGAGQMRNLKQRYEDVATHFPSALSADDFLMRTEAALCAHGFRGDNCITCTNLCRDESTGIFKQRIDTVFGSSFNINGLGACITCGNLGFKAGFSHAPNADGKERYVFFSFPHIAVSAEGKVGEIQRPGRSEPSAACGALVGALKQFQGDKSLMDAHTPSTHDVADPEFTILKQKLAARIRSENADVDKMDLVAMTKLAQRAITADLETMISETVDSTQQDYAVVTGVHIHSWGSTADGEATLEWIAPASVYTVVDGKKTSVDLASVPAMTPRQLALLQDADAGDLAASVVRNTTVVESMINDPSA